MSIYRVNPSFNETYCFKHSSGTVPVLPNNTDSSSRLCGYGAYNRTLVESCCDNDVSQYECTHYCATNKSLKEWTKCLAKNTDRNSDDFFIDASDNAFCQGNIEGKTLEGAASGTARPPTKGSILFWLTALSVFLFLSPASASPIDEESTILPRKQLCGFIPEDMDKNNYTMAGKTMLLSEKMTCKDDDFCTYSMDVDFTVNRTINGEDQTGTRLDDIFGAIKLAVHSTDWPATSQLKMKYDWLVASGNTAELGFTPYMFCTKGTAKSCHEVDSKSYDDVDSQDITACMPHFVSDYPHSDGDDNADKTLQGFFNTINTGPER